VTSDLVGRVWQHREGVVPGFTKRYGVHRLVFYEAYGSILDAIEREKELKKWHRDWKIRLIEQTNPEWVDLYDDLARRARCHLREIPLIRHSGGRVPEGRGSPESMNTDGAR